MYQVPLHPCHLHDLKQVSSCQVEIDSSCLPVPMLHSSGDHALLGNQLTLTLSFQHLCPFLSRKAHGLDLNHPTRHTSLDR